MRRVAPVFPFCYFLKKSTSHEYATVSTKRRMPGGWADPASLPKGGGGRNLCRWCNLEVPQRRRTFCSDWCVEEWRLRSDPGYLRERVLARDGGVCAKCGVDCLAAQRQLKRLRGAARIKLLLDWGLFSAGRALIRKSLWDADHIVPVVEGGGECDLANIRTLCLKCHRAATAELRARRASAAAASSNASPS
jgi:5-methylcytosine-specific restriction protein A